MLRKLNAIRSQSRFHRKRTYAHGELDLLLLLLLLLLLVRQCRARVAKCFVAPEIKREGPRGFKFQICIKST